MLRDNDLLYLKQNQTPTLAKGGGGQNQVPQNGSYCPSGTPTTVQFASGGEEPWAIFCGHRA